MKYALLLDGSTDFSTIGKTFNKYNGDLTQL